MKETIMKSITAILCVFAVCVSSVLAIDKYVDTMIEAAKYTSATLSFSSEKSTTSSTTVYNTTSPSDTAEQVVSTTKSVTTKSGGTITTAPTTKPSNVTTTKKQGKTVTCTIEIECKTILNNLGNLRPEKKAFLPKDGYILKETTVSVAEGSTVFDVLKLVCKQNTCPEKCTYCRKSGIQLEYVYTPGYDSKYIRGIHQLYEKDCGTQSGWMYSVNGVFPNYGVNKYTVKNGDKIRMRYTCNGLGEDIGASFMG